MNILVVNIGSSSIKLDLMNAQGQAGSRLYAAHYPAQGKTADQRLKQFLHEADVAGDVDAVVHRVVHGGTELVDSCVIDDSVEHSIDKLSQLAPLHNPPALDWIRACQRLQTVQVAVFDTAFFSALPEVAHSYAIATSQDDPFPLRRYGFHGIAHRAMWQRWCELRPDLADGGRLITVQLGGGCSISAIQQGRPLDTSMGFSPVEGLVMATRSGDIDPAMLIHLLRSRQLTTEQLETLINRQSGLLGISGKSADMRDLIDDPDAHARLAVELYCYRLRKYIGAYIAVLNGIDGIVFGGGVGEHIPQIRSKSLEHFAWAGLLLSAQNNRAANGVEMQISAAQSRIDVRVIAANESAVLLQEATRVLRHSSTLQQSTNDNR